MAAPYQTKFKCPRCGQETDKKPYQHSIYHKGGNHPLITQYNEMVDKLEKLEASIGQAQGESRVPKPKYGPPEVVVQKAGKSRWEGDPPIGTEIVRITQYLLNEDEKEDYMAQWGGIGGYWDKSFTSVEYYRTKEGILTHTGGGRIILKDTCLVSDQEWEDIKAGKLPERLLI